MDIEIKLKKLGFSDNLASVYLALFEGEAFRAGELIKLTGLQRSVVYTSLDELVERGLTTKTFIRGVATYRANNPEALEAELDQQKIFVQSIVKNIKQKYVVAAREIAVYEGIEGIKRAAEKNLTALTDTTVYFLGPSKFGVQKELEQYWHSYHKERVKKKIRAKILYDRTTPEWVLSSRNSLSLCEARYLPFGTELPMWFNMCDDTLTIVVPAEEPPVVFCIKSHFTTKSLISYFEYLWNQSEPFKHTEKI